MNEFFDSCPTLLYTGKLVQLKEGKLERICLLNTDLNIKTELPQEIEKLQVVDSDTLKDYSIDDIGNDLDVTCHVCAKPRVRVDQQEQND